MARRALAARLLLAAATTACASASAAPPFAGNLTHFWCDVKTALNASTLNATNAPALVGALATKMRCNGLRVPLLPTLRRPRDYPAGYNASLAVAGGLGLALYGSPMERAWEIVTAAGTPPADDPPAARQLAAEAAYTSWLIDYVSGYGGQLAFLSPFNEVGAACDAACMRRVAAAVRAAAVAAGLPHLQLVGPDDEHVASTLAAATAHGGFAGVFDVLSSHNAGADGSNDRANWRALVAAGGGRPVWSSENPACFTVAKCSTSYGTMAAALVSGVAGLVPWATLGRCVDPADGSLTPTGADIVGHVVPAAPSVAL
jgi:hypothetical protein